MSCWHPVSNVPIRMWLLKCTFSILTSWAKFRIINKNFFSNVKSSCCQTEYIFCKFIWTERLFRHIWEPFRMNVVCFYFWNISGISRNNSIFWLYRILNKLIKILCYEIVHMMIYTCCLCAIDGKKMDQ